MAKYDDQALDRLKADLNDRERAFFSSRATYSVAGLRRRNERIVDQGYRQMFAVDVDRILHSLAYTRYIDKTQVFYLIRNDHITHRVLHVQLVSKIARTIGRYLGLNEDLIEAIALGHDIGHAPFGHDGERILSDICHQCGIGSFQHNIQSVQFLEKVERKGKGWNLCLQTLDGILCHDGEVHNRALRPDSHKTFARFDDELTAKISNPDLALVPMTLEGCVVRMADTVSYIGRDIEDAIRLQMISRREIPAQATEILGNSNGTIVFTLVTDIIKNSHGQGYTAFSSEVSEALKCLKAFNLKRIYLNPIIKRHLRAIRTLFEWLFEKYLDDLAHENHSSVIFSGFLADMSEDYVATHQPEEIVRDFVAGMTDRYFLSQCPAHLRPTSQVR